MNSSENNFSKSENVYYEYDVEELRNQKLIEEHEEYEKSFFSTLEQLESFEMDLIFNLYLKYLESLCDPFEFEDYLIELRDEKLIEEHEEYEKSFLESIDDEFIENDLLDIPIDSYDDYICDYEYDVDFDFYDLYDDDYIYFLHYGLWEPDFMEATYCGCILLDYIPTDGCFDRIDGCDYPECPNENLEGMLFY